MVNDSAKAEATLWVRERSVVSHDDVPTLFQQRRLQVILGRSLAADGTGLPEFSKVLPVMLPPDTRLNISPCRAGA